MNGYVCYLCLSGGGGRLCGDCRNSLMYVVEVVVKGRNTFTQKKKNPAPKINGNSFEADGIDQIIVVCR